MPFNHPFDEKANCRKVDLYGCYIKMVAIKLRQKINILFKWITVLATMIMDDDNIDNDGKLPLVTNWRNVKKDQVKNIHWLLQSKWVVINKKVNDIEEGYE